MKIWGIWGGKDTVIQNIMSYIPDIGLYDKIQNTMYIQYFSAKTLTTKESKRL